MFTVASNPIVELKQFNESFFITINGETLYERGIVDKRFASKLFEKVTNDICAYIKKRWPIQ